MKANMLRLFTAVDRGLPLPFGAIGNRRSLLFVGNAAAAFDAAVRASGAPSGLYLLSDGEDLSTGALVRAIAEALGRPARLLPVPQGLFTLAGWMGDGIASLLPWPLTSATVQRLTDSLQIDSRLVRSELGFEPPYSVAEGLRETAAWYRSRGAETA
jgi:nucleoside-diphosphate-sugar epimerase